MMGCPDKECNIITLLYVCKCMSVCCAAPLTAETVLWLCRSQFRSAKRRSFFSAAERGIKCRPWISCHDSRCVLGSLCAVPGQWDGVGDDYEGETERHTQTLLPPKLQCLCSLLVLALWTTKTSGTRIHNDMDVASVTSLMWCVEEMLWSLQLGSLLTALLAVIKRQNMWIWPVWWSLRRAGVGRVSSIDCCRVWWLEQIKANTHLL